MTPARSDEADLPPTRPVVDVHLPEETDVPTPDGQTTARAPESPAPAPTPAPCPDPTPRASEAAHGAVGGAEVKECLFCGDETRDLTLHLLTLHDARRLAEEVVSGEKERANLVKSAWTFSDDVDRLEAEVARLRAELAETEQHGGAYRRGVRRGREQAAQAILAMEPFDKDGDDLVPRTVAAQLARGATPTPAGGEAESPTVVKLARALEALLGRISVDLDADAGEAAAPDDPYIERLHSDLVEYAATVAAVLDDPAVIAAVDALAAPVPPAEEPAPAEPFDVARWADLNIRITRVDSAHSEYWFEATCDAWECEWRTTGTDGTCEDAALEHAETHAPPAPTSGEGGRS